MSYYVVHKKHYWQRKLLQNSKYFDLRLIRHKKISEKESEELFKKYVEIISLETSAYCNRVCNYCPVSIYKRTDKSLIISQSILNSIKKALKKINYNNRIDFSLFNEPLANKMVFDVIEQFSKELPKALLSMNSNGDYIKNINQIAKLQEKGLKELTITLHTPPKQKWKRPSRELAFKRFAKKINFKISDNQLKNLKFTFKIKDLFCIVHSPNWFDEGSARGGIIDYLLTDKIRQAPCAKPFREFTIYYDGFVTPCCEIYHNKTYKKYDVGQILPDNPGSVFNVYSGKNLTAWRKHLFDYSPKDGPCSKCKSADDRRHPMSKFLHDIKEDVGIRKNILEQIPKN